MEDSLREAKDERDTFHPDCDAVFAYEGTRLKDPKRSWATAMKAASLEGTLFHDMRRSANRKMRDAGLPQGIRMRIMGHKTTAMDRRYGIVDLSDIQIARDLMSKKSSRKRNSSKGTSKSGD